MCNRDLREPKNKTKNKMKAHTKDPTLPKAQAANTTAIRRTAVRETDIKVFSSGTKNNTDLYQKAFGYEKASLSSPLLTNYVYANTGAPSKTDAKEGRVGPNAKRNTIRCLINFCTLIL